VLFTGAALAQLRRDVLNEPVWSEAYHPILPALQQRLREADFEDMERFLRDAKEHGDAVHYWAARETLHAEGYDLRELTPLLDGARDEGEFKADTFDAILLTF